MEQLKQIILLMKAIDRQVTKQFEQQTDISMTRYELLFTLINKGTVSQQILKQALQIDQAAITRHLKLLEDEQLVERNRNEKNNREVLVSITEAGRNQLMYCQKGKNHYLDQLAYNFSQQELELLNNLLQRLQQNSDQYER
ncbi:MarR family transcriptional regulator [Solibacillus sp. MA9]|uniref:MarR family transcriptional regulator n=1 Tax=Solibacillus palustris TaxID=2908203 RepID=A0ABS9UHM4_9BACL|nr:MarR family transcriptional regulator [Solibacillus sp. MA9]MCH7323856.1 MarR family transcriptional regulator [Solibacillus sp. MA9]